MAQRISTVIAADRIILLENGRIAASGTTKGSRAPAPSTREILRFPARERRDRRGCAMSGRLAKHDGETMPPIIPTTVRFLRDLAPYRLKLAVVILLMAVFALTNAVFSLELGTATNIISAGRGPTGPLEQVVLLLAAASVVIWVSGTVSQKLLSGISQEALLRSGPNSSATSRRSRSTSSTGGRSAR